MLVYQFAALNSDTWRLLTDASEAELSAILRAIAEGRYRQISSVAVEDFVDQVRIMKQAKTMGLL